MRITARIVPIVVAFVAVSCGGSGGSGSPTAPSSPTLAGTWKATRAEFVSAGNSNLRVEVVAKGTTMVLTLDAGGSYTQKITDAGQAGQTTTGTWAASSDVLTLKPTGMSFQIQFDMALSGNNLTLNGGHVTFDVNGDGSEEEALLYMTLARQ